MALPKARVQLLDPNTGEPVSDIDILSSAEQIFYTNPLQTIKDFRGIPKGTTFPEAANVSVKSIVDKLLYPYIKPEIQYVRIGDTEEITENKVINIELLDPVNPFYVTVVVNVGSMQELEFIVKRHDLESGTVQEFKNSVNVTPGTTYQFQQEVSLITRDTAIDVIVTDNNTMVASPEIKFLFKLPVYVGNCNLLEIIEEHGLLDATKCTEYFNTLIRNNSPMIEKRLLPLSNQKGINILDILYEDRNLYPFILYPNTWNKPVSITDANNNNMIGAYQYCPAVMIRTHDSIATDFQYTAYVCNRKYNVRIPAISEISYNFISDKSALDHISTGIPSLVGFDIMSDIPADSRVIVDTHDDLINMVYPYPGLVTYVKENKAFFEYTSGKEWVPSNQKIYITSTGSAPSDELGTWNDICIDLLSGIFYQKYRNVRWEEKGRLAAGAGDGSSYIPGPPGDAGTITFVSTTTLPADQDARVVNIGDKQNARLELYIPRGPKGDKGDPGIPGNPGEKGETGSSATIRIGAITPGDTFTINNSGTTHDAVLDFTYPRALDMLSRYNSLYPEGAIFQTTDHSFNPNGIIPGTWTFIGSISINKDGDTSVVDLYQNGGNN